MPLSLPSCFPAPNDFPGAAGFEHISLRSPTEARMKAYLITTGTVFASIVVAHVWRITAEPSQAKEPWFLALTFVAAAFSAWAFSLVRKTARS